MGDDRPVGGGVVIRLVSCLGAALDLDMLPHFLAHYASIGIAPENMHIILQGTSEDGDDILRAATVLRSFGAAPPKRWIGDYTSDAMWAQRRALQEEVAGPADWIVNSDIDEHYHFPAPLADVVAHCLQIGVNCVQGLQIDRFAPNGVLAAVRESPSQAAQFPIEGEASFHIFGTGKHHGISATTKLMLHSAQVFPRRGGHNPEGIIADAAEGKRGVVPRFLAGRPLHQIAAIADPAYRFAFPFTSAHFKWTASRIPSVRKRIATDGVSPAGEEYGGKILEYLGEHGRMPLENVALKDGAGAPAGGWRKQMRIMRAEASAIANPAASGGDVFVVVRAAGERTQALAQHLAAEQVGAAKVALLREVPFATAIRKACERGTLAGAKWTLFLDADVLLRPGAIADLVAQANRQDANILGISGQVADPLLGQWRVAGQHLYRTSLLHQILDTCDFDPAQRRPESYIKRQMKNAGSPWIDCDLPVGLHDAEQSFVDIFRKVVVHSRKHARFMEYARAYWDREAARQPDLKVALHALERPEDIAQLRLPRAEGARNVRIDRREFPDDIGAFLTRIGLTEKAPLPVTALTSADVTARLAAFREAPEWLRDKAEIEARHAQHLASLGDGAGVAKAALDTPRLLSCVGVDGVSDANSDLRLLPHFVRHYQSLGVAPARMHFILNARTAESASLAEARAFLDEAGTAEPEVWIGEYTSAEMWKRRSDLQIRTASAEDWILNADVDEFHDYPCTLKELTTYCAIHQIRCVQGPMIDRISADGSLRAVAADTDLGQQFPVAADVGIALGKTPGAGDATGTIKLMLHRGDVLPTLGGHHPKDLAPRHHLYGMPLTEFPRIKASAFRAHLPFRVWHYKWTDGLAGSLERRRAAPGASPAGSRYGGRILAYLEKNGGRIALDDLTRVPLRRPGIAESWQARIAQLSQAAALLRSRSDRANRYRVTRGAWDATTADGWTVRQLTFGSGAGQYHAHSYYDIPILNDDATRIAAYRMNFEGRWMTSEDAVQIGIVDVAQGGFVPIGISRAWSWQQGPMAQWLPGGQRMVWNDRIPATQGDGNDGDRFVARIFDLESGRTRTIARPIYALSPDGHSALSVNMARLDAARPGYGYTGGAGAGLDVGAPQDDGMWRLDLRIRDGAPQLILPLARAVAFLAEQLPEEERAVHLSGAYVHWFNHVKISPDGRRFTAKLRWRDADLKGGWSGLMGVSVTCNMDGTELALLERGTSHVMWLDDERLYFWHQAEKCFAMIRDAVPRGREKTTPFPDTITANVHFRHIPDDPDQAIYDTPYAEEIDIIQIDQTTGQTNRLARFTGHVPHHGPFRCDLHPVPSRDGRRIVVTSLQDGGRQLYLLERTDT
ncbi:hypothetical protein KDD17_04835 [Sulfitobacter albidus]|uniref:Glycosyltransferase n=1 Tax=Sulfitobacter albidus TaxID=2829501 RepID=A0A975PNI0_9RHOB|nr:hypothetical protein [Sulfitobacter albidus]QUJ77330.1 hypothetical protein KDD17_04835 [Sulfitobacter albidus]